MLALGDSIVPGSLDCYRSDTYVAYQMLHCAVSVQEQPYGGDSLPAVLLITASADRSAEVWLDEAHPARGWCSVVQP